MNKIMVDNWFMEEVIADICDNKTHCSKPYAELLMAIVLWETVCYPKNDYSWWDSVPSQVQNALIPIDDNENVLDKTLKSSYRYSYHSEGDRDDIPEEDILLRETGIICDGALRYMTLSHKNGCDYLPCSKRQTFLQRYRSPRNFDRFMLQDDLDKTIEEYYRDTFKALSTFSDLSLQMPVLANFVIDNTPKEMNPVDYAFHLKEEGSVIRYRQYLSQVENSLEDQDWRELRFLLNCSKEAISEVISLDKKHIWSVNVDILPTPSLTISKTFSSLSRKIHLTFLKDLTEYAISDLKL